MRRLDFTARGLDDGPLRLRRGSDRGAAYTVLAVLVSVLILARGGARVELAPTQLEFPTVAPGAQAVALRLALRNAGEVAFEPQWTLVGDHPDDFRLTATCGQLSPGASCPIEAEFDPSADGPRRATVQILDAHGRVLAESYLLGEHQGRVALEPTALTYLGTVVNNLSPPQSIRVHNEGLSAIRVETSVDSSDFLLDGSTCTVDQLPPDGFCELSVRFRPQSPGAHTAHLTVETATSGLISTATLSGQGIVEPPAQPPPPVITERPEGPVVPAPVIITISPTRIEFVPQRIDARGEMQLVTITNDGSRNTRLGMVRSKDGDYMSFTVEPGGSCRDAELASHSSCTEQVRFNPQATERLVSTLVVEDGAGKVLASTELHGVGLGAAVAAADPPALAFEEFGPEEMTVAIWNRGQSDLQIKNIEGLPAHFEVSFSDCVTAVLGPDKRCSTSIRVSPGPNDLILSTELVVLPTVGPTLRVPLTWKAAPETEIGVRPDPVEFESVNPPGSSTAQAQITNHGMYPTRLGRIRSEAPYFVDASSCEVTLQPGARCTVDLSFRPTSDGSYPTTVPIRDSHGREIGGLRLSGKASTPYVVQ